MSHDFTPSPDPLDNAVRSWPARPLLEIPELEETMLEELGLDLPDSPNP